MNERRRYFRSATQTYKALNKIKLQLHDKNIDDTFTYAWPQQVKADDGKTSYKIHGDLDYRDQPVSTYIEILPASAATCTIDLYRDGMRYQEAVSLEAALTELSTYKIRKTLDFQFQEARKLRTEKEISVTHGRRGSGSEDPNLNLNDLLRMTR